MSRVPHLRILAAIALLSGLPASVQGDYRPHERILLQEITASNQAAVNFTSLGGGQYKHFLIEYKRAKPATDDVRLNLRMTTDGGSSWASGASDYSWKAGFTDAYGSNFWHVDTADSMIGLGGESTGEADWGIGNGTDQDASGWIRIFDPASTSMQKVVRHVGNHSCAGGAPEDVCQTHAVGRYLTTTAVNGFQLFFNSGNIASGVFRLYGWR